MTSSSGVWMVDLRDRSACFRVRNPLRPMLHGKVAVAAWVMVFASAATAQAPPEPPASCATSIESLDLWDERIEIATMPDSVVMRMRQVS